MLTGIKRVVAIVLTVTASGQVKFSEPVREVNISGRIVDSSGAPVPYQTITFRNVNENGGLQDNLLKTDVKGRFAFSAESSVVYQVILTVAKDPLVFKGIGIIEVVDGRDAAMGDIVMRFSPRREPFVQLAGPIQITEPRSVPNLIAAACIACSGVSDELCAGGTVHIVHGDGQEVQAPTDKEQAGSSSVLISKDKRAVGWLVDYPNCCTSYPLPRKLLVYRPGKPLQEFRGDGRAIFDWRFVPGGKQVAFYQDFPHGMPAEHFELRDIETGRLLGKWNGALTRQSPAWAKGLGTKTGF